MKFTLGAITTNDFLEYIHYVFTTPASVKNKEEGVARSCVFSNNVEYQVSGLPCTTVALTDTYIEYLLFS